MDNSALILDCVNNCYCLEKEIDKNLTRHEIITGKNLALTDSLIFVKD